MRTVTTWPLNVERNAEVWRGTLETAFSRSDASPEALPGPANA